MPFEPESMKLDGYDCPLNTVVMLPAASTVSTFAGPSALFDWEPMP